MQKTTHAKSGEISISADMSEQLKPFKRETKKMDQKIPCEHEHDFVLVLSGIIELTPAMEDALFESGCDDATISVRAGRVFLTFTREAVSIRNAILSAIRNVRDAGIGADVLRVDDCNLVTQSDIARKIGRSRQLVHQFMTGARGPGGFPAPSCQVDDSSALWRWCEVAHWLWENGMLKENALRAAQDVDTINCVLDFVHKRQVEPEFVKQFFSDLQSCEAEK
jgi:hypothetical protein